MKITRSFGMGMVTGAVVGTIAGMIMDPTRNNKKLLKNSGMFSYIGNVVDSMINK